MTKNYLRNLVAAAFVAASGASNVAFAIDENEPNDAISSAQRLVITRTPGLETGSVEVTGILGAAATVSPVVADVDFFSFHGRANDKVTVDIDGGVKVAGSMRSVDTVLAVFGPDGKVLRQINDASSIDEGSRSLRDARLTNVVLPVNGVYTVGVSSSPRLFVNGGGLTSTALGPMSNGGYTLIISGVTPSMLQISIDIKPGAESLAPINPKSKGNIPVALLSSAEFDALKVDRNSLTFGPGGGEASLLRCGKTGEYINADTLPDLVCHFDNQLAGFEPGDDEGVLRGTIGGLPFEGRGWLKAVPHSRPE